MSELVCTVDNIIVADACIDLVVDFDSELIGFSGMSKTEFHFTIELPSRCFGARMMPGAFYQLTGIPAPKAMDSFLPLVEVFHDFGQARFFSLSFEGAQAELKDYLSIRFQNIIPDQFTRLFNKLSEQPPSTANELYQFLNFSPRQSQRLFDKHYGIKPKMALSILRFQRCLEILTSQKTRSSDIFNLVGYYDQPHLINDFKLNIGITPQELIRLYQA